MELLPLMMMMMKSNPVGCNVVRCDPIRSESLSSFSCLLQLERSQMQRVVDFSTKPDRAVDDHSNVEIRVVESTVPSKDGFGRGEWLVEFE